MPETLAVFNELGESTNFLVQARFCVSGQEYIAITSLSDLVEDTMFLRVEIDGSGNTIYIKPLPGEAEEVSEEYNSLKKLMN